MFCDVCGEIMEKPNLSATRAVGAYTPMLRKVLQSMKGVSGGNGSEVCEYCENKADKLLVDFCTK